MTEALIVPPGAGRRFVTRAHEVTFKVTGEHSRAASTFEVVVPPGFDVGAHVHRHGEELFYVLEGELDFLAFEPERRTAEGWRGWRSAAGDRPVRAGAGSCLFVPPGCPHAFANRTDRPARMLFQQSPPPAHERYFEQLMEVFDSGRGVDSGAVARLRERYDVHQLTPLRYEAAAEPPGPGRPGGGA